MPFRFCDEFEHGFGWVVKEFRERASHAIVVRGDVWLVDPLDWPEGIERAGSLGKPRVVVQLLHRHGRDCAAVARRLGVPHLEVPIGGVGSFEAISVVDWPGWRERALWWPEKRVLVCADALGTAAYFLARGERLGVHPLLRPIPPRRLGRFAPSHILSGHGEGVHGETAADALREALATARRRLPAAYVAGLGTLLHRR